MLCDITTEELTEKSILANAKIHFHPVREPTNIKYLQPWPLAEEAGMVNNPAFHKQVADMVNAIPEGRILILVKRLSHGDALKQLLPQAYWIQGQDR